jgi:hypothetical protein
MCLERFLFYIALTFSSFKYVEVEDREDLFDIVEEDLDVNGRSSRP